MCVCVFVCLFVCLFVCFVCENKGGKEEQKEKKLGVALMSTLFIVSNIIFFFSSGRPGGRHIAVSGGAAGCTGQAVSYSVDHELRGMGRQRCFFFFNLACEQRGKIKNIKN